MEILDDTKGNLKASAFILAIRLESKAMLTYNDVEGKLKTPEGIVEI